MTDEVKTRAQLLEELEATRRRVVELEAAKRKQTEVAQRPSEKLIRSYLQNAPVLIFVTDLDCTVVFVSATVSGLDPRSVSGTSMYNYIQPMHHERVRSAVEKVLHTAGTTSYQIEADGHDDSGAWYEVLVAPLRTGDETTGLVFTSIDITERMRMEQKLAWQRDLDTFIAQLAVEFIDLPTGKLDTGIQKSLQAIAELVDANRSSVFLLSDDLEIVTNTHEWCASPSDSQIEQLQGIPFETFGYYARLLKEHRNVVVSSMDDLPPEAVAERKWCEQSGFRSVLFVPMLSEGILLGTVGFYGEAGEDHVWPEQSLSTLRLLATIFSNVLERKRAEEELRESGERYRSLADTAEDFIFLVDRHLKLAYTNPAGLRVLGRPAEDAFGKSLKEIFPGLPTVSEERLTAVLDGERPAPIERLFSFPGGDRWLSTRLVPVADAEGGVTAVMGISRDITERKRAEEERRKMEAQFQQTQKLESLGLLAGGIAHDFNNILTSLLGNVDLAIDELPSHSQIRPLLVDVQKGGRQAANLSRQMLAYSGQGIFVIEDIDINALVHEMSSLLESAISKKVGLSTELSADLPAVRADATQLRQIVLNLVSNATDAVGDKGGLVRLRTHATDYDSARLEGACTGSKLVEGRYVTIEVTDTGCGMDDETKDKLFEPFFTTKSTGRGLGLAVVQGIVRGHKGAILVDSELGKGTTFKVLLPTLDHPAAPVEARTKEETGSCGTGMILVVDDEEMVREVAGRILERLGFSVLMASDGVEAINIFRERHDEIACVLLDLKMPNMDGKETFDEMRRINDDVPVILCSGFTEQYSTEQFVDGGLAGFIEKPYGREAVRDKLREVLGA
jgi:PAS domain S-box-containing protein